MNFSPGTSWRIKKYGRFVKTGWSTIDEGTGSIGLILQPEMGHTLVLQNATVLESVPLMLDPETVQVHVEGDVLMFVITNRAMKPLRKFRLFFARGDSEENPRKPLCDCLDELKKYFPIRETCRKDSSALNQVMTLAEAFENIITFKNGDDSSFEHLFTKTSLAGPPLDNLVRLCLLDPTFPSLVGSVQKSLKSLNDPVDQ